MKQSVKIALTAITAVALFGAIVLGRYIYSEINRLKVGEPIITNDVSPTSTPQVDINPTSTVAMEETSLIKEYKSQDDWTTFVLPNGTELTNPFYFYGTTTAFENNISWRLVDENGVQVAGGYAYVNSPDMGIPGPFKIAGFFDMVPATSKGRLEVYEASPRDGSDTHKVVAEVTFSGKPETIKIFFGNTDIAPLGQECEIVFPVERMVVAGDDDAIAIHELLKGPNLLEQNAEYFTSLPENVPDPNISYTKDGVSLDFSDALEYQVGGSCRVQAIRKQIEETIKEATGETEVTISINSRTEDILQP